MNKCFSLNDSTQIYIYGGGSLGKSKYDILINKSYNVKGIIDKNAEKIENREKYNIMSLNEYKSCMQKHDVIIICVHNAYWHDEIAFNLYQMGVENIIYIPMSTNNKLFQKDMMRSYYYFENGAYNRLDSIPRINVNYNETSHNCGAIIDIFEEYYVFWMDITFLYSSYCLKYYSEQLTALYSDTPICGMLPYVQLFEYIQGYRADADLFCDCMKKKQNKFDVYSKKEFLADRIQLFYDLKAKLNHGMDYFIYASPETIYENHLVYLLDGMTRVSFLNSQKLHYVPVKMRKEDFEHFFDEEKCKEIQNFMYTNNLQLLWELEHPYFYDYNVKYPYIKYILLCFIQKYFGGIKFYEKNIADFSNSQGAISRYFARQGATVYRMVFQDGQLFERLINDLFGLDNIILNNIENSSFYELSYEGVIFENEIKDRILNRITSWIIVIVPTILQEQISKKLLDNKFCIDKRLDFVCDEEKTIMIGIRGKNGIL